MPPFQIEGPWTDESGDVSSSDHSEFEISSDVSDPEVLEMKRVLEGLRPVKIRSNLADATVELQKQNMKLWGQYCGLLRKDPVKVLKKCSFQAFAGYSTGMRRSILALEDSTPTRVSGKAYDKYTTTQLRKWLIQLLANRFQG